MIGSRCILPISRDFAVMGGTRTIPIQYDKWVTYKEAQEILNL